MARRGLPSDIRDRGLALIRAGWSNKAIAAALEVHESTVSRWGRRVPLPDLSALHQALAERPSLTGVEREVLALAGSGRSARDIARLRGTSPRTVANQLRAAYAKLAIGSRRELRTLVVGGAGSKK